MHQSIFHFQFFSFCQSKQREFPTIMARPNGKTIARNLLTAPIRILTDPLIAAPLLIALLYYPNKLRQLLPTVLRKYTASPGFIRALKLCIGFSIARNLNGTLSHMAINNWRPGSTWGKGKEKELVLITGGSSGFGECMARKFVERGVEVVVIDLKEPKTPFRLSPSSKFYLQNFSRTNTYPKHPPSTITPPMSHPPPPSPV